MVDHQPDNYTLAQEIITAYRTQGWTIATAESCTGGLIASTLTDISGSSAVILGGVITYSNEAKQEILHVPQATLMAHGAVSEATAHAMAEGARKLFSTDVAVSVTGIAGPGGGTPEKPVGLVYIGIATAQGVRVDQRIWLQDRLGNKSASVYHALQMLRDALP